MKNTIWILMAMLFCSACDDILDDQIPEHNTIDKNIVTDEATAEVALTGTYSYLAGLNWEFGYIKGFANLAGTWAYWSDEYDKETAENDMNYDDETILSQWQGAYEMVLSSNWVIDRVEKLDDKMFKGNRKKEILAEARFLRFFGHYYIFRKFCKFFDLDSYEGLIYRLEPVNVRTHITPRLSVRESYEYLLKDLDYVIENGPEFVDGFHASKNAGKAFKAELLMMRGQDEDFAQVITLADSVINNHPQAKTLEEIYTDDWAHYSSEIIFERYQSQRGTWPTPGMADFCYSWRYTLGDKLVQCLQGSGYMKWYQGDIVSYLWQFPYPYENAVVKMFPAGKNYEEIKASTKCYYMRVSELYLLKAEAIARQNGPSEDVISIINEKIYKRAGHPLIPAGNYSREELLELIYKAFLLELSLENGIEFPIALRFDDPSTGMCYLISQKTNLESEQDEWKFIQPIPQEEVRINTLLKQNEGYPEK